MQAEVSTIMPSSLYASTTTNGHADKSQSTQSTELEQLKQLTAVSTTVLHQALDLVENVLTRDEQLSVHSQHLPGSTIGAPGLKFS
jgi:hypothetical protein